MIYMNPENAAMRSLDRRKRIDEIEQAARKLLPLHKQIAPLMEKIAIHPSGFENLYDREVMASDAHYVEHMKKIFAAQANEAGPNGLTKGEIRDLAEILEFQIIRGINEANWLPYVTAMKTAEYDDIKNGVDLVLIYEKGLQMGHMGMGVDISFSHNLRNKFQRIKDEIDAYDGEHDQFGVVKYFHNRQTGYRGELSGLPRVVAALDVGTMEDLAHVKGGGPGHIAQHTIVSEMEHQLAVFADYARKNNPLCLDQIMRAQNFMHTLNDHFQSDEKLMSSEYRKNEKVQDAIEEGLSLFR